MTTTTLMLDQGYAPVSVISVPRAITLLFLGKVEVVEEYDQHYRSTKLVIKIPAVVRLLRGFRRHKKPVKFSRVSIYGRDNYRCQYCGDKCTMDELTYDHVVPRALGGKTTWTNIVVRSAPGSLASWIFAPRKDWQIEKPSAMAVVVIQMSMPNRATLVSHTGLLR